MYALVLTFLLITACGGSTSSVSTDEPLEFRRGDMLPSNEQSLRLYNGRASLSDDGKVLAYISGRNNRLQAFKTTSEGLGSSFSESTPLIEDSVDSLYEKKS